MAERACRRCLRTKPLADFRPSNAREGHERKRQRFDAALEAGDEPAEAVTACAECRAKVRAQENARVRACREHYHALRGALVIGGDWNDMYVSLRPAPNKATTQRL